VDNGRNDHNGRKEKKSARQQCVETGHGANVSRDRLCVYSSLSFGVSHIYIERQWLWKRREEARGEREKERETLLVVGLLPNNGDRPLQAIELRLVIQLRKGLIDYCSG
jgi:hypothetical protein